MEPRIVRKDAFVTVGLRIHTSPMSPEIPAIWPQLGPRIDEVQFLAEPRVSYGIMDNLDVQRGSLDYMAGVSVSKLEHLPDGMVSWKVPSNTYAVFETTLASIGDVFSHIYGSWLPTSGYEQLAVPYFERYGESFNPGDPSSTLEIYIPVRKLGG